MSALMWPASPKEEFVCHAHAQQPCTWCTRGRLREGARSERLCQPALEWSKLVRESCIDVVNKNSQADNPRMTQQYTQHPAACTSNNNNSNRACARTDAVISVEPGLHALAVEIGIPRGNPSRPLRLGQHDGPIGRSAWPSAVGHEHCVPACSDCSHSFVVGKCSACDRRVCMGCAGATPTCMKRPFTIEGSFQRALLVQHKQQQHPAPHTTQQPAQKYRSEI
jgi:hypothetical protein